MELNSVGKERINIKKGLAQGRVSAGNGGANGMHISPFLILGKKSSAGSKILW
jgi:hypothetical protein